VGIGDSMEFAPACRTHMTKREEELFNAKCNWFDLGQEVAARYWWSPKLKKVNAECDRLAQENADLRYEIDVLRRHLAGH